MMLCKHNDAPDLCQYCATECALEDANKRIAELGEDYNALLRCLKGSSKGCVPIELLNEAEEQSAINDSLWRNEKDLREKAEAREIEAVAEASRQVEVSDNLYRKVSTENQRLREVGLDLLKLIDDAPIDDLPLDFWSAVNSAEQALKPPKKVPAGESDPKD